MKCRRLGYWTCAGILLLLAGATLSYLTMARPRINRAVCNKLSLQETLADVQKLVNAPPGDYSNGFNSYDSTSSGGNSPAALGMENAVFRSPEELAAFQERWPNAKLTGWWGRNCVLVVEVDDQDRVIASSCGYCQYRPDHWLGGFLWSIDQWLDGKE